MAYNSDGYIMLDFTEVDFRRTTQTIEGFYDRCVQIIGTNKFILVINANGKTPLPSVCSFVNNQYVIESCIYTFAITSADMLIIKRNDPADIIDDTTISDKKTWSSEKISSEIHSIIDGYIVGTITSVDSNVTSMRDTALAYLTDLVSVNMPNLIIIPSAAFRGCTSLEVLDFPSNITQIGVSAFNGCTNLKNIFLRGDRVPILFNINTISASPFASNGTGGTLHVPADLIESYQSASIWSTILSYPNNSIVAIE